MHMIALPTAKQLIQLIRLGHLHSQRWPAARPRHLATRKQQQQLQQQKQYRVNAN